MFRAGATKYLVRIWPVPLVADDGDRCDGLCDPRTRTIKLCPTLPLDRRFAVLCHELMHAWLFTIGNKLPRDVEACCDLFACAAEQLVTDLVAAGGVEALIRLRPGEELGLETAKIGLLRARYCRCGGMVAPGEIACARVPGTPDLAELAMACDHCRVTLRWRERLTAGGAPSGEVVGEAKVERGNTLHLPALSREVAAELA